MKNEKKNGFDYGTVGIVVGVIIVILSIVVVTIMRLNDDRFSEDITWVG
ncbi:hypothetical protein ACFL1R_07750 [Candidatus Latescibacterota bacterium]